jgi:hypothetical protein
MHPHELLGRNYVSNADLLQAQAALVGNSIDSAHHQVSGQCSGLVDQVAHGRNCSGAADLRAAQSGQLHCGHG